MEEYLWNGVTMHNPQGRFRLGTDSMVLADFVRPGRDARVCDLGCGCGTIGLMLLASHPSLSVTGIEIQEDAAVLAAENIRQNGLEARFSVLCGDLRQIRQLLPANSFSCVVTNPPYFPVNNLPPEDAALAIARTELCCTPEDLCDAAAWLLTSGGSFSLVHKPERLADLICCLRQKRLEPKRLQFVRHSPASRRSLLLLEAVLDGKAGMTILDDLILHNDDGTPTEDFLRIYHRSEEA